MMRRLDPVADRAAVERLFARAADHVELERGPTPPAASADDFFAGELPPGVDPSRSLHLALDGQGGLDGVAEVVFGYPEPGDAYIGLLLLAPEARGRGLGVRALAEIEAQAGARGATRVLVAVLEANAAGLRFWRREGFEPQARFVRRPYGDRVHDVLRLARPLRRTPAPVPDVDPGPPDR